MLRSLQISNQLGHPQEKNISIKNYNFARSVGFMSKVISSDAPKKSIFKYQMKESSKPAAYVRQKLQSYLKFSWYLIY